VRLVVLVLYQQEQAVFQRLREWYLDAKHKSGKKRRDLDVPSCFAPLLRWIVRLWGNENQQMVLVLADRGLYVRWLFQAICTCGWHPFLRINLGVKARAVGEERFDWISRWAPARGKLVQHAGLGRNGLQRRRNVACGVGITAKCREPVGWSGSG
jgi:hypothetical protein